MLLVSHPSHVTCTVNLNRILVRAKRKCADTRIVIYFGFDYDLFHDDNSGARPWRMFYVLSRTLVLCARRGQTDGRTWPLDISPLLIELRTTSITGHHTASAQIHRRPQSEPARSINRGELNERYHVEICCANKSTLAS
ncbi:hypothetical protein J6590_060092 [Homalodisca vitripennis]|nr:hypothetical protein J6590_060092 [Homalodisca vitripennis]